MYDHCPICIESSPSMVKLPCGHSIHEHCLQQLVKSQLLDGCTVLKCPLCRKQEPLRVVMGKTKHSIFINVMNPFHICDVDCQTFRISWLKNSKPLSKFHPTCYRLVMF